MNVKNKLTRHLHNFGFTRTAAALNKGTQGRGVDDGALVCGPTVSVRPVPLDVAPLAIVVTR